ncbi:MAG: hypothetical protein OXF73_12995 [Gammaproteobacteria bacterium]|nr:hypothetical protein [Gammaproteobacteria bacterium]MCY4228413.1 hypothetical protein [Gammaproteobacteria bacterium]
MAAIFTKEMQKNLDAYEKIKNKLERESFGKIALMHDGKLDSIYNDKDDAYQIGCDRFGIGHFAIKTIGERLVSLGIYTMCVVQ